MISVTQAESIIRDTATVYEPVVVPLEEAAGRTLRETITADRDLPPFNRVAMDGIGIAMAAWQEGQREFKVVGDQPAGAPPRQLPSPDQCFEVMTGAVLPNGCDCVIRYEDVTINDGVATVVANIDPAPMHNVHLRASDNSAGAALMQEGIVLRSPQIAVLASVGKHEVLVDQRPRVAIVSTGDELVGVAEPVEEWQIRQSNGHAIAAALGGRGYPEVGVCHVPDNPDVMREALKELLGWHHMLILSGGVSMGKYDYVPELLAELGVEKKFHKVSQRPGKPLWFGSTADGRLVFGLPGNPVSALTSFHRYIVPALELASGGEETIEHAALAADFRGNRPLTYFLPVKLEASDDGRLLAHPRQPNGSGDYATLADSDGFIELDGAPDHYDAGTVARLYRW
jgi:molybdopterin molybdotransferase